MGARETLQLEQTAGYRAAQAPLSDFVGFFWYWRGHSVPQSRERVLPMPTPELVIDLAAGRTTLAGPRSAAIVIERKAQDELLGVHFRPAGIFPFLQFPADELHGHGVALADVWGAQRAEALLEELRAAPAVAAKFDLLEAWLLRLAEDRLRRHPAVAFALRELGRNSALQSTAALAERAGFSQRRFIQLFRNEVGLTPKLFSRVVRFQKVIGAAQEARVMDWSDVALACGYFDQAHFNHDFREFSGLTPTEYFALRTGSRNHVQVR